jgi:hypothetical protein
MPGRICPHHHRLDAGSHGPGSAPVQGMARQPPAPCRHDGRAVIAGPPPPACCCSRGRSILLGHGVAPGGMLYANRLEESVRLAQKLICRSCVLWCVGCCHCNLCCLQPIHQCGTMLLAREKQWSLLFVVDSPYCVIWYYSTTRVSFDPAKFLPSFKVFAKFQTWQPSLNLAQALPSST